MLPWKPALALLVVASLFMLMSSPADIAAQPPAKVALDQAGGKLVAEQPKDAAPAKAKTRARELRRLLAEPTEKLRGGIDPGTPLKDALDTIGRLLSTPALRIDFRIDYGLFKKFLNEDADKIDQRKVGLAALPKGQTLALEKLLRDVLVQVDATYLVQGDEILVVPDLLDFGDQRWAAALSVNTRFDKLPLAEALEELSDATGISVVLDAAAGEKGKTPVTATLMNVPLPAAVRTLSNMADLKPVVIDNVLYVTTKEKANELIEDSAATPLPLISRTASGAA
jgi:hypothetical protein